MLIHRRFFFLWLMLNCVSLFYCLRVYMQITFDEKGWVGLCPVYVSTSQHDFCLMARHKYLEYWLDFNEFLMFPIQLLTRGILVFITGKLDKPIVEYME